MLTQLQDRFASRLGSVASDIDLLLGAQPRTSDYLIEAATLIRETVGVGDYRDAVVALTTAADEARTPLHDLIEDLEPLGIITFNYDLGHENAYRARRRDRHRMHRAIYSDERKLRAVIAEDFRSRFLLKAHGCISRPKTIVLDRASYREVMARQPGYRAFAHHVLARFSALIVGFGLNDPDFEDLLQSFEASFGGGVGEHVYIWKRGQREDEEARALVLRRRYGLVCLFVDSFDDVRTVISDARTHMGAQLRRTISATLKRGADVAQFRQLRRRGAHRARPLERGGSKGCGVGADVRRDRCEQPSAGASGGRLLAGQDPAHAARRGRLFARQHRCRATPTYCDLDSGGITPARSAGGRSTYRLDRQGRGPGVGLPRSRSAVLGGGRGALSACAKVFGSADRPLEGNQLMSRRGRRAKRARRQPFPGQRCLYASSASSTRRRAWRGPNRRLPEGSEVCAARFARTNRSDP